MNINIDNLTKEELEWLKDLVFQQSQYYEHFGLDSKFVFTVSERWQIAERINVLYKKIKKALDNYEKVDKVISS
jgi:hypothetical protein